ncbi:hypothetical protein E1180_19380 [Roseibium denhamense]|uniref:Uncharacterized protein n=1 Tax=Roseibium denhamense TaxID=76305 RepID=A0ABY1P1T4_9HYPH|nr:hypothetical protein [Roseibium denhamense]MTI07668.1 hypothetical protein [Roseibium denhamense]SMP24404.1 hypothetical protein SAMN06265374_2436 [Roseibium denhamense]
MPVQTDPTLQLINPNNAGFGTVRLLDAAYTSDFRYNLGLKPLQMPSVYYAENSGLSDMSSRFRPLHEHGFLSVIGNFRLYFAVAGLQMENPRNALTTNLEQVGGDVYKSKYYVFVKLGINYTDFQAALTSMRNQAANMSTAQLIAANAGKNVTGPTGIVYINAGALQGTFWAHKNSGWEFSIFSSDVNKLYRPMSLMDFPIAPGDAATARLSSGRYGESLQLIPTSRRQVHHGHSIIDPANLAAYYAAQAYPDGAGGGATIAGATVWNNFQRLGNYRQYIALASNNALSAQRTEIVPGNEYYERDMFKRSYPYRQRLTSDAATALQTSAVANMVSGFVNV